VHSRPLPQLGTAPRSYQCWHPRCSPESELPEGPGAIGP
jgi:hypothetical protein